MDDTLEHPDDGLRERIRKGFEDSAKRRSKKIEDRPKTPRNSSKEKRAVTISKKVTEISEKTEPTKSARKTKTKTTSQKKETKMEKKPVVRKPKTNSEVVDEMKKLTLKQTRGAKAPAKTSAKKAAKPVGVYLCPKCDKTYKSKNGIVKHMEKCK